MWSDTYEEVLPVLNNMHQLTNKVAAGKHWPIRQLLHDRRAGIEPLIGHTKQGCQMGRSRMKSDETTKSVGYASVFGFNTRQLTRYLAGEARPKIDKDASVAVNDCQTVEDATIKQG